MRIILACDRSGGHIFPARCLARFIKDENLFFFAPSPRFKSYLKKEGFTVYGRILNFRNIILEGVFRIFEAVYLIVKIRPHRVIGFGGRDAFFIILFSRLFFIEAVIYEPNAVMGKANRVLALFVNRTYRGMPYAGSKKFKCIGIPLRDDLTRYDNKSAKEMLGLNTRVPVIMCFGGSQGSRFINHIFRKLIESLGGVFSVIHIVGFNEYSDFVRFYGKINRKVLVYDFFDNIGLLYSAADVIICRAGALTIAEVISYRIPAVFVPYPGAGSHQEANAYFLKKQKACYVVNQSDYSFYEVKSYIKRLLDDEGERLAIINNLKKIDVGVSCEEFYKNFT